MSEFVNISAGVQRQILEVKSFGGVNVSFANNNGNANIVLNNNEEKLTLNYLYSNKVGIEFKGTVGLDGASAYQLWLAQGNTGTEQDFINTLGDQVSNVDLTLTYNIAKL